MKDELGGEFMTKFAGLRAKTYQMTIVKKKKKQKTQQKVS